MIALRPCFDASWRRQKSTAFDLEGNSTSKRTVVFPLWGTERTFYANANLSIYSAQACNARCPFCVEELRPAARGRQLAQQRHVEPDDARYFGALEQSLQALAPLDPSISITGGEPSLDPRLPRLLATLASFRARKLTLTTNGSGLLDRRQGRAVVDHLGAAGARHLNISVAHPNPVVSAQLMHLPHSLEASALGEVVRRARQAGTRPRLSCVLLADGISDLAGILSYLEFARSLHVDNVIFRQLMRTSAHEGSFVVRFCDSKRVLIEPLLNQLERVPDFALERQIIGYYYYVEVWRWRGIDVVFEEADLGQLERSKTLRPDLIHELVFHPSAQLASTWQPWDGVLGPIKVRLA
ncbi:MAG TPA: radical SAM protein [Polyangia bacterium]